MELISVIVPIYKVETYLNQCVQSIVDQTYKNLEIILVDDGSPDRCGAMCEDWAARDSRIKVIHKENGGLSDARNAGLAVASGSLISFIDSDDWIEPEFLQRLFDAMESQNAQIGECAIRLVDEKGKILRNRGPARDEVIGKLEALRRLIVEDGVYQTVWNKLYRREVIDGILFEKGKYNEDDFWTYQVFDRMEKLILVDRPMYNYLQRGGSIMGEGYTLRRLDSLEARFRRMEYLQKYEELKNLTQQQLMMDYMWHLQSILRNLCGQEKKAAVSIILNMKKATPRVPKKKRNLNRKYQMWYAAFVLMPRYIARLRNLLGIGL